MMLLSPPFLSRRPRQGLRLSAGLLLTTAIATALALLPRAAEAADAGGGTTVNTPVFTLGEITVTGQTAPASDLSRQAAQDLGGTVVSQAQMRLLNKNTLDEAFNIAPGTSINVVGARNETNIWIRGFDRYRITFYQDGIPIYLPADNRIDFGRFTTADIGEIQISKGFTSVIDGPGAMGGSVNIVSRTVRKPFEADIRTGVAMDSVGSLSSTITDMFTGVRRDKWYAQAAITYMNQSHFRTSQDFNPGTFQPDGNRIKSGRNDFKVNLKAGYTPNTTDEYALNVIDQHSEKGNPPPDGTILPSQLSNAKFWTWPNWDKQSIYFLSRTRIDDEGSFIKTRLYYDRFYNRLQSYDSATYMAQATPKSFDSLYDDRAAGAIVEVDKVLFHGKDVLRASVQTRWDQHNETQSGRNAPGAPWYAQPWETSEQITSSFALENIVHLGSRWDLTFGGSYDYRHMLQANQFVTAGAAPPFGYSYAYPVRDKDAPNGEAALVYRYNGTGSVHVSYADRVRFPTLFEMYSTRFGTFVNNPNLQPERSHYGQVGISDTFYGVQVTANAFYARIDNAIAAVGLSPTISTNRNVGTEQVTGYEIALQRDFFNKRVTVNGSYSYLDRNNVSNNAILTDTPRNKLYLYAQYRPIETITLVASADIESNRILQGATNSLLYYHGGAYAVFGLKGSWEVRPGVTLDAGITNLTDQNYMYQDGYHAPGRGYFTNARVTF